MATELQCSKIIQQLKILQKPLSVALSATKKILQYWLIDASHNDSLNMWNGEHVTHLHNIKRHGIITETSLYAHMFTLFHTFTYLSLAYFMKKTSSDFQLTNTGQLMQNDHRLLSHHLNDCIFIESAYWYNRSPGNFKWRWVNFYDAPSPSLGYKDLTKNNHFTLPLVRSYNPQKHSTDRPSSSHDQELWCSMLITTKTLESYIARLGSLESYAVLAKATEFSVSFPCSCSVLFS